MVTQRKLSKRGGSEGPRHDPYSWSEYVLALNGVDHTLRLGALGYARYFRDDDLVLESFDRCNGSKDLAAIAAWEAAAGMDVGTFERAYERVHPYFEDPMGSLGRYE